MIYLSGKIVRSFESQLILKLPSGVGYLLEVNPNYRYIANENIDFFVLCESASFFNSKIYAFNSWEEFVMVRQILEQGVTLPQSAQILWEIGLGRLQRSIATKDDSLLRNINGLGQRFISKILEIGDSVMQISASNSYVTGPGMERKTDHLHLEEQQHNSITPYTATEFTRKMAQLGYTSNKIVEVISILKKEDLWGKLQLIDIIKTAIDILEGKERPSYVNMLENQNNY
jgi:Holliday junction resolvasome RuvABC DNA-binding subunit